MEMSIPNRIELLKVEFEKLTTEQRMYVQQYAPTLNVFGVTVLAGFAAALVDTKYQAVYPLLPLVLFMIAYIGIGQTHMVASLGIRIRKIEEEFRDLNGGNPIIQWEHIYAPHLVFAPWVRLPLKGPAGSITFVNPILMSGVYMAISGLLLVVWCCIKSFYFISGSWGVCLAWVYVAVAVIATVGAIVQSFGFFALGKVADRVELSSYAEQSAPGDAAKPRT